MNSIDSPPSEQNVKLLLERARRRIRERHCSTIKHRQNVTMQKPTESIGLLSEHQLYRRQSITAPLSIISSSSPKINISSTSEPKKRIQKRKKIQTSIESDDELLIIKTELVSPNYRKTEEGINDDHDKQCLTKWEYLPKSETKLLFSVQTVSDQKDENNNFNRLDLEEQGLYVGLLPDISNINARRLLNRLKLTESSHNWFITNDSLDILPDPISYAFLRPPGKKTYELLMDSEDIESSQPLKEPILLLKKAELQTRKTQTWNGRMFQLVINLSKLSFSSHPLMLVEERIANSIIELVDTVNHRKRTNLMKFLNMKLQALKTSYLDAIKQMNELKESIQNNRFPVEMYKQAGHIAKQELELTDNENTRYALLKEIKSTRILRV